MAAALAGYAGATLADAAGDTTWQKNHPRREEVNQRLRNQNNRIHQDVKDGTMTRSQAAAVHQQDRQVRQEERDMASQNNGHITKTEQQALNQQENGISKEIPPK
jgi:arylamine N-acetyltransferase